MGVYKFSEAIEFSYEKQVLEYSIPQKIKENYHTIWQFYLWAYTQEN
jgi:hypothetical protein